MSLSRCCVMARVPPHPDDALRWVGPELQPRGAWCLYAASIAATITALAAALAAASTATSTSLILARRCSQVLVSASGVCAAAVCSVHCAGPATRRVPIMFSECGVI